jgi:hypothetical protein
METTAPRVPADSAEEVNQRIRRQTDGNIRYLNPMGFLTIPTSKRWSRSRLGE